MRTKLISRRAFLEQASAWTAFSAVLPRTGFAYSANSAQHSIDAFHQGRLIQQVPSLAPAALIAHPDKNLLYAANAVEIHENLPRGTVEVYLVDPLRGGIQLMQRRPLSLSGIMPQSLALSPDGHFLVAAAHAGGLYNAFPIASDGSLQEPPAIFKELGRGPHATRQNASRPHSVLFHPGGLLIASDLGCDRLSTFMIEDGLLRRVSKIATAAGSGPGALAIHPNGTWLYVQNELQPSIACHPLHSNGSIGNAVQRLALPVKDLQRGRLALDQTTLYASAGESLFSWRIGNSGRLADTTSMAGRDAQNIFRFHVVKLHG